MGFSWHIIHCAYLKCTTWSVLTYVSSWNHNPERDRSWLAIMAFFLVQFTLGSNKVTILYCVAVCRPISLLRRQGIFLWCPVSFKVGRHGLCSPRAQVPITVPSSTVYKCMYGGPWAVSRAFCMSLTRGCLLDHRLVITWNDSIAQPLDAVSASIQPLEFACGRVLTTALYPGDPGQTSPMRLPVSFGCPPPDYSWSLTLRAGVQRDTGHSFLHSLGDFTDHGDVNFFLF